ncbi:MAG TPA: hypothetical protein ENI97_15920 [Gammaproteobacteria bacterium]|nr:hypothetical protein [Gammaproteobacteria bacterium]
MRSLFVFAISLIILLPSMANAETEEEEMARIQRELNAQLFGMDKKPEPPPPPPAAVPAPNIAPAPALKEEGLPLSTFTKYRLAGVSLGMAEADVKARLQAEGYACNMAQMQGMAKMLGRNVCVYASMEAPKIAMFTLRGGQIRDFELHESYKTGFPEEIFKRAKQKFLGDYGDQAKCKKQRRGELCEIFGHGYRIVLRSELDDDEAKIIRSVHTM